MLVLNSWLPLAQSAAGLLLGPLLLQALHGRPVAETLAHLGRSLGCLLSSLAQAMFDGPDKLDWGHSDRHDRPSDYYHPATVPAPVAATVGSGAVPPATHVPVPLLEYIALSTAGGGDGAAAGAAPSAANADSAVLAEAAAAVAAFRAASAAERGAAMARAVSVTEAWGAAMEAAKAAAAEAAAKEALASCTTCAIASPGEAQLARGEDERWTCSAEVSRVLPLLLLFFITSSLWGGLSLLLLRWGPPSLLHAASVLLLPLTVLLFVRPGVGRYGSWFLAPPEPLGMQEAAAGAALVVALLVYHSGQILHGSEEGGDQGGGGSGGASPDEEEPHAAAAAEVPSLHPSAASYRCSGETHRSVATSTYAASSHASTSAPIDAESHARLRVFCPALHSHLSRCAPQTPMSQVVHNRLQQHFRRDDHGSEPAADAPATEAASAGPL